MLFLIITHILRLFALFDDDDDGDEEQQYRYQYQQIGNVAARDVYGDLYGTPFFPYWVNCNETHFQYIHDSLHDVIGQPRNIHFNYTPTENLNRRRRRCKISDTNRVVDFLHVMGEAPKVWCSAADNGWNPSSQSRDFRHVLWHFVDTFAGQWIRPLTNAERISNRIIPGYSTAYSIIDGCMFMRRRTKNLKPGIRRRDYYDKKHNHPESVIVQCIATYDGVVTHLLTGNL